MAQVPAVKRPPPTAAKTQNPLFEGGPHGGYETPAQVLAAEVPKGSLGPRLVVHKSGKLLVWLTPSGPKEGLFSVYVSDEGKVSPSKRLASANPAHRSLEVARMVDGSAAAVTVRRNGNREIIELLYLGPQGALRGGPHRVAEIPGSVLWTKMAATKEGGLLLWAERTSELASIHVVPLRPEGPGAASRIVGDVAAWQIAETGSALTLVTTEGRTDRSIVLRQLGARGQVVTAPIQLARSVQGGLDLDVAISQGRIVAAWTARVGIESRLFGTTLDRRGKVLSAAAPLTRPRGEQALVRAVASGESDRVYLVWDEPDPQVGATRQLLVGELLASQARMEPSYRLAVEMGDPLLPAFAASSSGLAILTQAKICGVTALATATCAEELRSRVAIQWTQEEVLSTPLLIDGEKPPAMAWDLTCSGDECDCLVAGDGSPTQVFLARLGGAQLALPALVRQVEPAPRLVSREALSEVPELADLDALSLDGSGNALLSWISYFDPTLPYVTPERPAPDGRRAPVRALLKTVMFEKEQANGEGRFSETVISYRARSLGGVAIQKLQGEGAVVVWAALDNQSPQIFATVVDGEGRKLRQQMLTRHSGEVSDVAAMSVEGGTLIVWVDGREETSQIYGIIVDDQLQVRVPARPLTADAVSPTGLSLAKTKDGVVLVWADSRGGKGHSDIYVLGLDERLARPDPVPHRLLETDEHSHSPELSVYERPDGSSAIMCAWVDSSSSGTADKSRLFWAQLAVNGELIAEPKSSEMDGSVRDFSLSCTGDKCRSLMSVESHDAERPTGALWAAVYDPETGPKGRRILGLRASLTTGVTPVIVGESVFFADLDDSAKTWILHRASIDWFQGSSKPVAP